MGMLSSSAATLLVCILIGAEAGVIDLDVDARFDEIQPQLRRHASLMSPHQYLMLQLEEARAEPTTVVQEADAKQTQHNAVRESSVNVPTPGVDKAEVPQQPEPQAAQQNEVPIVSESAAMNIVTPVADLKTIISASPATVPASTQQQSENVFQEQSIQPAAAAKVQTQVTQQHQSDAEKQPQLDAAVATTEEAATVTVATGAAPTTGELVPVTTADSEVKEASTSVGGQVESASLPAEQQTAPEVSTPAIASAQAAVLSESDSPLAQPALAVTPSEREGLLLLSLGEGSSASWGPSPRFELNKHQSAEEESQVSDLSWLVQPGSLLDRSAELDRQTSNEVKSAPKSHSSSLLSDLERDTATHQVMAHSSHHSDHTHQQRQTAVHHQQTQMLGHMTHHVHQPAGRESKQHKETLKSTHSQTETNHWDMSKKLSHTHQPQQLRTNNKGAQPIHYRSRQQHDSYPQYHPNQQAMPRQMIPQQMIPQQMMPQQMMPQQMMPQQMMPQQMMPQQFMSQQFAPQQAILQGAGYMPRNQMSRQMAYPAQPVR